jgi:hypothetical protein
MIANPSADHAPAPAGRSRSWLKPDPRLGGGLGLLLIIAIWSFTRPYRGVRHDAILYLGQTFAHLWPERMGEDIFFHYGSQDRFSVFAPVMAMLVRHFGVAWPEMVLLVACQVAFMVAVWKLAGHFMRPLRLPATLCAIVLPHTYGSLNVFGFAESFLTARSVAEPLVLFALVAWARHKTVRALVLFGLGMAMHPLIAIPGLVVAWLMRVQADRRWAWIALVALPVLALAVAGVAPFDGLLHRYEGVWWEQVQSSNRDVMLSNWKFLDWQSLAVDPILLWFAVRHGEHRLAAMAKATLWATAGLLAVSLFGVDLFHDVLLAGLQLWRVLWITHLLALICLPLFVYTHWRKGSSGRLVAVAGIAALVAAGANFPQAWVLVAWLLATLLLERSGQAISPSLQRIAFGATVASIGVATLVIVVTTLRRVLGTSDSPDVGQAVLVVLATPTVAIACCFLLNRAIRHLPTWGAAALLGAILALGALHWDQRDPWQRELEASALEEHPFDHYIAPTDQVYWHDALLPTWMMLKRPSFYSDFQGAGLLFNRSTAEEFARRRKVFLGIQLQGELCHVVASIQGAKDEECAPTQDLVDQVCKDPLHPRFMVFPYKMAHGLVDEWTLAPSSRFHPRNPRTYYLYDCTRFPS